MFTRSNLSLLVINRETRKKYDFVDGNETFNRLIGLDYNLASPDNIYVGRFYYHKSFNPDSNKDDDDSSYGASIERNTRENSIELGFNMLGEDFKSDLVIMVKPTISSFCISLLILFRTVVLVIVSSSAIFDMLALEFFFNKFKILLSILFILNIHFE